jgi:predicted nuclease of restriction endonuclease-like (RecB) superfamily
MSNVQVPPTSEYGKILAEIADWLHKANIQVGRTVNAVMTATYWRIGQRIVEEEQRGHGQAEYGKRLISRLAEDLTAQFGRGYSQPNLFRMRSFYLAYRSIPSVDLAKLSSASRISTDSEILSTASIKSPTHFPLSWSHYVRLLSVDSDEARIYYEREALRGGWTVRMLDRQIATNSFERLKGKPSNAQGLIPKEHPDEYIRDPFVLEFLNLHDDYSELDLESALIRELESFLLELGNDFAFVARQKRLRIGTEWYKVDLVFFHRRLRCLLIVELKVGKFSHADAGQMNLYLNYAREHWVNPEENPPVGLILCSENDEAVAHYSLEGLTNKVLAREYQLTLPDERRLAERLSKTRKRLQA